MKLMEFNWRPADRQLRQFAGLWIVALPLIVFLWDGRPGVVGGAAAISLLTGVAGLQRPAAIRPLFLTLTLLTAPIGMIAGELLLLAIYFGVFLPTGLLFRLTGRDALQLQRPPSSATCWRNRTQPRNAASYYRQFTVSGSSPSDLAAPDREN